MKSVKFVKKNITNTIMDLQTRKLHFIQDVLSISNEELLERLESLLKKERSELNQVLKEKLTSRALRAEQNLKEGKVYSSEEARKKIKDSLGI